MKAPIKAAIAMFGGAAAVAVTVGFGGVGVGPSASASPKAQSSPVAPAPAHHAGVHAAALTSCISGSNC
jgi:hypothetical protein